MPEKLISDTMCTFLSVGSLNVALEFPKQVYCLLVGPPRQPFKGLVRGDSPPENHCLFMTLLVRVPVRQNLASCSHSIQPVGFARSRLFHDVSSFSFDKLIYKEDTLQLHFSILFTLCQH